MNRLRKDNRGVTLLELIIAILILGLLVAPLLRGFVVSAQTALKARRHADATSAATYLIENIKGSNLDAVLARAGESGFTLFSAKAQLTGESSPEVGTYAFDLSGYNYNGRTYHSTLKLDAMTYKDGNTTFLNNDQAMIEYSFNGLRCGTEMADFDVIAANDLATRATASAMEQYSVRDAQARDAWEAAHPENPGGYAPPPAPPTFDIREILSITSTLKRTLTLEITLTGEAGAQKLQILARCNYTYTSNRDGYDISVSAASLEQQYHGPFDPSDPVLYFFYFPMYVGSENINIEIKNQNIPLSIFLIKQWPMEMAKAVDDALMPPTANLMAWMMGRDGPYTQSANGYLTLRQPSSTLTGATVFSNMAVNVADNKVVEGVQYTVIAGNNVWSERLRLSSDPVLLRKVDRIYELVVELIETENPDNTIRVAATALDFPDAFRQ